MWSLNRGNITGVLDNTNVENIELSEIEKSNNYSNSCSRIWKGEGVLKRKKRSLVAKTKKNCSPDHKDNE
jgi:hypothetical protein